MPVVINSAAGKTVVVDFARNIATVSPSPLVVRVPDQRASSAVLADTRVVKAVAPGPQGKQGVAGLSGAGVLPTINFAFGDATPATILLLGQAVEVALISLQIEETFDGVGASIQLGVAGSPGMLMAANQNDPSALLATFETTPRQELAAGVGLVLNITPGAGATRGRGQFIISTVPVA
jgi:hypothetical protein